MLQPLPWKGSICLQKRTSNIIGGMWFPDPVNPGNPTHCPQDMKDMTITSTSLLVSCWGERATLVLLSFCKS